MSRMTRLSDVWVGKLTSVLGTTPAIPFGQWAGAVLVLPGTYSSTSVAVYTAAAEADTFRPLKDGSGNAVTFTVAQDSAIVLPASVYGCQFLKLVTSADDSSRDVSLCRKG